MDLALGHAASSVQRTLTAMPQDVDPSSDPRSGRSAVVVPFGLPSSLARIRRGWDVAAHTGAGPHVTILYPFLPCAPLGRPVRTELAAIARGVVAFDVRFERVRRLDGLIWIEPEPADGFLALTESVVARWPDHPPYAGTFDEVVPHLTVVESEVAPFDTVEAITRQALPFPRRADRLELWCQDTAGRWRPRWRMPFAVRP